MAAPLQIKHPVTKEIKSLKGWGQVLQIPYSTMRHKIRKYGVESIFQEKDSPKLFANPTTNEQLTAKEWGERIELGQYEFSRRLRRWGANDPRCYEKRLRASHPTMAPKNTNEIFGPLDIEIARRNNALFCINPETGVSLPAYRWAELYNVSLHEFYQAMKRFGRNSLELYKFFENRSKAVSNE